MQKTQVWSLNQGRYPGERNGNPLQYSCLENYKERGAWWAAVHGIAEWDMTEWLTSSLSLKIKSTLLSGLPRSLSGQESACEEGDRASIPGSGRYPGEGNGNPLQYSCLGNPWTEEPGGQQSMGSQRVRHNWETNTHTQPTGSTGQLQPTFTKDWRINHNHWELSSVILPMSEKEVELSMHYFSPVLQKDESSLLSHRARQEAWGGAQ